MTSFQIIQYARSVRSDPSIVKLWSKSSSVEIIQNTALSRRVVLRILSVAHLSIFKRKYVLNRIENRKIRLPLCSLKKRNWGNSRSWWLPDGNAMSAKTVSVTSTTSQCRRPLDLLTWFSPPHQPIEYIPLFQGCCWDWTEVEADRALAYT